MRLPPSSNRPLSIFFASVTFLLALVSAAPSFAGQAPTQLVASPASVSFGLVTLGQSETQEIVLTNTGETATVISAISVGAAEFTLSEVALPTTLSPGQSTALNITFAPTGSGLTRAIITVTSNAGNPTLAIDLQGKGTTLETLTSTPSNLAFGQVSVGTTTASSVVLTNPHTSSLTITGFSTVGSSFSVSGPSTPFDLGAGQSFTLSVSFAPQAAGAASGSIFIYSTPRMMSIPLAGTAVTIGQLNLSPASLNFGNVDVGNSTTQPASLTATGGSVTISSATSSNSQFSISGISLPATINAGQTMAFDVVFAPTNTGADSGTLTFVSNATSQNSESLSGTGISQQYSVNLSWNASTSPVSGYNVYRGTSPGSYAKINPSLDANTTYSDSNVVSGTTYYYSCTSVNSSGQESQYSTPVEVSIP
jgi:hypothetical protein